MSYLTPFSSNSRVESAGCKPSVSASNILVAVDESEQAAWAVEAVLPIARLLDGKVSLLQVSPLPVGWTPDAELYPDTFRQFPMHYDKILEHAGRQVPVRLLQEKISCVGDATDRIVEVASLRNVQVVVVGTHDHNLAGRLLLGSTAEAVVRRVPCPVLVVGHPVSQAFTERGPARILIAVDDSEQSRWAFEVGAEWARGAVGRLLLVHAVPDVADFAPAYGIVPQESAQDQVKMSGQKFLDHYEMHSAPDVPVDRFLVEGLAADAIVTASRQHNADLVIVGTHGRRGLGRLLLGSTAEAVLRHVPCPVLCVGHEPAYPSDKEL